MAQNKPFACGWPYCASMPYYIAYIAEITHTDCVALGRPLQATPLYCTLAVTEVGRNFRL